MGESENRSSEFESLLWIVIVVAIVIGWIVISRFIHVRSTSAANACINTLRQIDGAKNEWALEYGKTNGAACTEADIKPFIKLNAKGEIPGCPQGGKYTLGKVGVQPTCSLATNGLPGHRLP